MPIADGQEANQTNFNATFMDRLGDTSTIGVVALENVTDVDSGTFITNLQQFINELKDQTGYTGEGDATSKTYSDNTIITNGDDFKTALGKLSEALNPDPTKSKAVIFIQDSNSNQAVGPVEIDGDGSSINVAVDSGTNKVLVSWAGRAISVIRSFAIADNSGPTILAATRIDLNLGFELDIAIVRGTNWIVGKILVTLDVSGTDGVITPDYVEAGDCGITWTTTVETLGGFPAVTLKYTTSSTGTSGLADYDSKAYAIPT